MADKQRLNCKDLYGYLLTLPSEILNNLYDHPFTCLAVFRGLPELAKHYVMRTIFLEQPVSESVLSTWVANDSLQLHNVAVSRLKGLKIWVESTSGMVEGLDMNLSFKKNLRIGLCGGGAVDNEPLKAVEEKYAKDIPFLDKYAKERWESVLYYMTGSPASGGSVGVSADVARVLINAGLLTFNSSDQTTCITSAGFQFLLMDTSTQVWFFMVQYLEALKSNAQNLVQCLSFLFQVSFSVLGKDYPVKDVTGLQFSFLQHLREIGLAFQRKKKSKRFYPTRLAVNLGTVVTGSSLATNDELGFLIVETNYRVYGYTNSALQIALLSLFTDIKCRFPEFCVGLLSRESVQQALACGISAEQIIDFLRTRAHPQMLSSNPVIPPTITDQIKLWEMERDRLRYTDGVLYNQFLSQSDFEMLRKHAEDLSVLLWANSTKRLMVVSKSGHDEVKKYWKKHKQS